MGFSNLKNSSPLNAWRQNAAKASGGTSGDVIYDMFERVLRAHRPVGKILDFGAGIGVLSRRLVGMQMFESVNSVDIMPAPVGLDLAVDWHIQDLNEPTGFPSESFEVIVSAEVIEHLENPRAVVREWFRLLKPEGLLLFSTPNNESVRSILALVCRGHYASFGDASYPAHITPLLKKDMDRILREAGFREPIFFYTDYGTIPRLGRITWQGVSCTLLRGLRFSDNVLTVARKPGQ
jgi:2-polyprenyl-3-methyl-5-hydroxy-6-metoxy-1,4-benzoquinol methylase